MIQLNEYGFLSGGFIFDEMDKVAHEKAKEVLGDCVTLNSSINFLGKTNKPSNINEPTLYWSHGNKACINVLMYNFDSIIATASFLFIKLK